jgi:sec-independent protein translocase protein TatC
MEKRPLLEHFVEFKKRLLIAVVAYVVAVGFCYGFAEQIYAFLVRPLAEASGDDHTRRMIYTSLIEAFFTYLKLAMFAGFALAFPVIASQVYLFLAPGLYKRERSVFLPYLIAAPICFIAGAAFCYYFMMPTAWKFFLGFESMATSGSLPIKLEAKVSEYLSLVTQLITAFGLAFQLPVVLTLLVQFGWVKTATLKKGRRYAVVAIVAVAAVITPPDVFSQIALSVPVYALYELSILMCHAIEKRKKMDPFYA